MGNTIAFQKRPPPTGEPLRNNNDNKLSKDEGEMKELVIYAEETGFDYVGDEW